MMRLYAVVTVLLTLMLCLNCAAMDSEPYPGEVLYHQSFADAEKYADCGITLGSAGISVPDLSISDGELKVVPSDSGRVYLLLPDCDKGDSYTAEFSFSFIDKGNDNAYLAFILTSRGDEPTNITSVIIRASGSIDNFTALSDEIRKSVSDGDEISVKIPLEDGVLHEILLSDGENSCTVERRDIAVVSEGRNGFVLRNADVAISDIYIVNGVGYGERVGYYASHSYSSDAEPAIDENETDEQRAPATGENHAVPCLVISLLALALMRAKGRKRA